MRCENPGSLWMGGPAMYGSWSSSGRGSNVVLLVVVVGCVQVLLAPIFSGAWSAVKHRYTGRLTRVTLTKLFTSDDGVLRFAKVNNAHHALLLIRLSSSTSLCSFCSRLTSKAALLTRPKACFLLHPRRIFDNSYHRAPIVGGSHFQAHRTDTASATRISERLPSV